MTDRQLLIFTPTGRDAALTHALLLRAKIESKVCGSMPQLCGLARREGLAGIVIAEEVLLPAAVRTLTELLSEQEPWSDLPIILFTGEGATVQAHPPTPELLGPLGNVNLLERPVRPTTMITAARAALRARLRQYAARSALADQQRAVRERDQFLAMLGHELRNPLSAILMAGELAARRSSEPDRNLSIIERQSRHLARLVDDLLDVSRVTTGKIVLRRSRFDVSELLRRSVQSMDTAIRSQRLSLTIDEPGQPVMIVADSVRIEQVIFNLLTNAIKYTPEGGRIDVSLAARDEKMLLRIRDNGVGIDAQMLSRIFEPFVQAEATLDRAKGGMGIGLTLVRHLVELHSGTVAAESEGIGRGSVFTVVLPLSSETGENACEGGEARTATRRTPRRILLVEDNDDGASLLTSILESLGHQVELASDGLSGVERALASPPDVLIVDIGLPILDGYSVARRVRQALGSRLFMVALTGYGQPDDQQRARAAGFDVHLTKPVEVRALEELIDRSAHQAMPA